MASNTQKLFHFLALFNISHKYIVLPDTQPRLELAALGTTYRRAPLLSINSDIYVDNVLIIEKLSDIVRHRTVEANGGRLDATNHVKYDTLGQEAMKCATGIIPPDMPFMNDPKFLADRSELLGINFNNDTMVAIRKPTISKFISLISLVESHFFHPDADVQPFFHVSPSPPSSRSSAPPGPSSADIHLYWSLNWGLAYHHDASPEITPRPHPRIFRWLCDVTSFLTPPPRRRAFLETQISWSEAYAVLKVPPTHEYAKFVPDVEDNVEGLNVGQRVKVTPVASGRNHPQIGELIRLKNLKGVVMHFPMRGYEVTSAENRN